MGEGKEEGRGRDGEVLYSTLLTHTHTHTYIMSLSLSLSLSLL